MSQSWVKTATAILKALAFEKELAQYDIPRKVNKHYSTIFRQLKKLEKNGLVNFVREERSKKKGQNKRLYCITFLGLLQVLSGMTETEINRVAEIHGDKWLIFGQWQFLSKIPWFFPHIRVKAMSSRYNYFLANPTSSTLDEKLKHAEVDNVKRDCTDTVLGLNRIFKKGRLWRQSPSNEDDRTGRQRVAMLLGARFYKKNPEIRAYVEDRFAQEEAAHRVILSAKDNWEQLPT
jgi:DNA-binding PadR family transcriptional regulator